MLLSIIVAVSENGVIGLNNQLIWRLPDDLKRFKKLTLGHPMIMGRKTFESIGKPLPGRQSIVITRDKNFSFEGTIVVHSLDDAIEEAKKTGTDEAFVIGGGDIYNQVQKISNKLYITEVDTKTEGDTFFKIENPDLWEEVEREHHSNDEKHEFSFYFVDFRRKTQFDSTVK
ncbi:dihydrofolate reductase [Dyadobacter frigoris]|uniref:Dihydrofolate reductase n=1 Tax=Dyadobacter frigoris TaxID=2576211 RepID=A0A4U6D8U2_9BACT|nr:dihydrofolate reductase [Dyadobacter frigoris]TKT93025.1 dihydrofolate reductase [Dyadobacter frigoris]GLU55897.1 dihydrofolate reductase [Dyadobacter frigoris]